MVAINGAASVDLTGQINVESAEGSHPINGPGGQQEFVIGALASRGGRSITVLRSTTQHGQSRIVPFLDAGASVTIPRTLADYVVTEYGIASLLGKTTSRTRPSPHKHRPSRLPKRVERLPKGSVILYELSALA